jgi:hypothetical protein
MHSLEHDPEKWTPVFGQDHAPAKIEHDPEKGMPVFGIMLKQKLE